MSFKVLINICAGTQIKKVLALLNQSNGPPLGIGIDRIEFFQKKKASNIL